MRLAEEVCAGRHDALSSVPTAELELVLEAVTRKRENDIKYLATANKRRKMRDMPNLPSIMHKSMYVDNPEILQCVQFANSCVAKGLQAANIKEWVDLFFDMIPEIHFTQKNSTHECIVTKPFFGPAGRSCVRLEEPGEHPHICVVECRFVWWYSLWA